MNAALARPASSPSPADVHERIARWKRKDAEIVRRRLGALGFAGALLVGVACWRWMEWPRPRSEGMLFLERQDGVRWSADQPLTALAPLDVDGDGVLELAVAVDSSAFGSVQRIEAWSSEGRVVSSWIGERSRGGLLSFDPVPNTWSAGDLDGDGRAEVLMESASLGVAVVTPASGVVRSVQLDLQRLAHAAPGDLDGDRLGDLTFSGVDDDTRVIVRAVRGSDDSVLWSTDIAAAQLDRVSDNTRASLASIGDQDGDGASELVCIAYTEHAETRTVWLNGASGAVVRSLDTTDWRYAASAGDVDGDGRGDVLLWKHADVAVFTEGGAVERFLLRAPIEALDKVCEIRALGAGDLDGDGREEVLLLASGDIAGRSVARIHRGADGSVMRELRWNGDTPFPGAGIAPVGDLDDDGAGDLMLCAPRLDDNDVLPHSWRLPRRSWVMVYSGRWLVSSDEPLTIR